jgi:hypothetical protein
MRKPFVRTYILLGVLVLLAVYVFFVDSVSLDDFRKQQADLTPRYNTEFLDGEVRVCELRRDGYS